MTVCLTVCYSDLADPPAFAESYVSQHVPLGNEILAAAGLAHWWFGPTRSASSGEPQFVATLLFEEALETVQEVLSSEEGQRLLQDALRISGRPFDSYVSQVSDLKATPAQAAK
jgi:uncharacterized protein (TIGR02118 family)